MLPSRRHRYLIYVLVLSIGALFACVPAPTPVPALPTSTVIPATATPTVRAVTPTPTPDNLLRPQDIRATDTAADASSAVRPLLSGEATPDAALTQRVLQDLAAHLTISRERVQLAQVEAVQWLDDASLGCETVDALSAENTVTDTVAGYRYTLLVGTRTYEYHTAGTERIVRCRGTAPVRDDLLLTVDPVAADMVTLVQQQIARERDLSTRRVPLVSITPYIWDDTSLGCPRPDQTYTPARISGYRIVVEVANETLIYHTDDATVVRCPAALEQLPPS